MVFDFINSLIWGLDVSLLDLYEGFHCIMLN